MYRSLRFILILSVLFLGASCLDRQFIQGKSEIVRVSDTALNDSSLFAGYVYRVDFEDYPYDQASFEVSVPNENISTTTDSVGFYSIKTVPGVYSIKCQSQGNTWKQLIEGMRDVKIGPNEKIQINFYIGYTVE